MNAINLLGEWAARNRISFVTRSDGMRTTETVSRDALMELIEGAALRDELAEALKRLLLATRLDQPFEEADVAATQARAVLAKYEASKS